MKEVNSTAVILGAGFSKCAGLPLTNDISKKLFHKSFDRKLDKSISGAIRFFFKETFNWDDGDDIPTLEEIFTVIDLSLNANHHLGRKFDPKRLTAIRRLLIYRIFQILNQQFTPSEKIDNFIKGLHDDGFSQTEFVVLNWDIVLEHRLVRLFDQVGIDYGIEASPWESRSSEIAEKVKISKIHGSSNWVYCKNCHSMWYKLSEKLSLTLQAGLIKADIRLFDEGFTDSVFDAEINLPSEERSCKNCYMKLSPHIATFSFQKSLNTHAFQSSWLNAEKSLSKANKWVFVGYSLPSADYEFKHLLKVCQEKYSSGSTSSKNIEVVIKDAPEAANRYKRFFGRDQVKIFQSGLEKYNKYQQQH